MSQTSNLAIGIAALAGGALGAAGGRALATNGAHESITIPLGDSVNPRFSVHTDSVLSVSGGYIKGSRCGVSSIYLRIWNGTAQRSADTVTATVPCAAEPLDTTAAIVIVCLQSDSQYKANPLPVSLDSAHYELAKQVADCGPDSIPSKAP